MKKTILMLGAGCLILSFAACGAETLGEEQEYREALPLVSQLKFEIPEPAAPKQQEGKKTFALIGELAEMYKMTRDTTKGINGSIWVGLQMIGEIAKYPPSSIQNGVATWGPHTPALSPVTWLLVVKKEALPTHYSYALTARPKNDDNAKFVPILAGSSRKGIGGYVGVYGANATALHELDPQGTPSTGKLGAAYDTRLGKVNVKIVLTEFSEDGVKEPVDLAYHYLAFGNGAGLFRFAAKADVGADGSAEEVVLMATQWKADGSGRGDAVVTGGDLPPKGVIHMTECWDDGFARTFYKDQNNINNASINPTEGDPQTCPFAAPPEEQEDPAADLQTGENTPQQ